AGASGTGIAALPAMRGMRAQASNRERSLMQINAGATGPCVNAARRFGGWRMSISGKVDPVVRRIAVADIAEALGQGLRDFQAAPRYGLAFGALYAAGGIVILLCLTALGMVYLAYPLAAGFALIGPFVAIGLYEVSRRLETGQPLSFWDIWSTV